MKAWLLSLVACAACSSASSTPPSSSFPFHFASASGQLHVVVAATPNPPAVGTDAFELTVTDASGAPVDDMTLAVTPWMPAMDHGTSTTPTVTPTGGGKYALSNVYLYMPGTWEFEIAFSGPVADHADPTFQVQ